MHIEFSFKAVVENTSFGWSPGSAAYVLCGLGQETNLSVPQFLV